MLRAVELFAGVGGAAHGYHRAGIEHVALSEWEEYPRQVLARHFPGVPLFSDVREIRGADLPACDVVIGSPPCQPFSDAGLRLGLDDPRHLFPHFLRLMLETNATYGIVENVRGLLTANEGRAFGSILSDAVEAGYTAEWQVLHAGTLGAPHRRARVFIMLRRDGRWTWPGPRQGGLFGQSRSWPKGWPVSGRMDRGGWSMTPWQYQAPAVWPWEAVGEMVPTPRVAEASMYAEDSVTRDTLSGAAKLRDGVEVQEGLRRSMLPTPAARDWRSGCASEDTHNRNSRPLSEVIGREHSGKLHPRNVEWMMGWPDGWTLADGPSLLEEPPQEWREWPKHPWTTTESEPDRRPRLKACGNGVVGPVAEVIGRALLESVA